MQHTVLAVDPGSRALGYGLIDRGDHGLFRARGYGVLRYSGDLAFRDRLTRIHEDIFELIERHRPDVLAIERAFMGECAQSAMKLGEARAAVIIAAGRQLLPIFEITPAEAKKAVAGNGRASKEQVRSMVCQLLDIAEDTLLDASDALSIGLAYLFRMETFGSEAVTAPPKRGRRNRAGRGWTLADVVESGLELQDPFP